MAMTVGGFNTHLPAWRYSRFLRAACLALHVSLISACDSERITEPEVTLRVLPESPSLFVGSVIRLVPVAISGSAEPETSLKWFSATPQVASVDALGRITGKSAGSTTVRVISAQGIGEVVVSVVSGGGSVRSWAETTCGVTRAADIHCWGRNDFGQAGTGDRTAVVQAPRKVVGGLAFISVSPSLQHTCGVATSGTYCWGNNWAGQVGDGTAGGVRLSPTRVATGETFTSVSTQSNPESRWVIDCSERLCTASSCGINAAGTLFCWGDGKLVPSAVGVATTFRDVSLGEAYACGLDRANVAYCWGRSTTKQTQGPLTDGIQPPLVPGSMYLQTIGVGASHNCAIDFDGDAYCWGANNDGQLGASSSETCGVSFPIFYVKCRGTPVKVEAQQKFLSIAAAGSHTCALATTLQVFCWGNNSSGQLGSAAGQSSQLPVAVPTDVRFRSVTAGYRHTCAVALDGDAYCWGSNGGGELGNGTVISSSVPTRVSGELKFR